LGGCRPFTAAAAPFISARRASKGGAGVGWGIGLLLMPSECEELLKLGLPDDVLVKLHKVLDNAADDRAVVVTPAQL